MVYIDHAEADDIIATLVMNREEKLNGVVSEQEPILILSSDKDFVQLQRFENVKQYSPLKKKFLNTDNPETFLRNIYSKAILVMAFLIFCLPMILL